MKKLLTALICTFALCPAALAEETKNIFSDLAGTHWYTYLCIALLIVFGVVLIAAGKKTKWNARMMAYAALCVALSYLLSCIKFFHFSFGGSITLLSMLPIMAFALANGTLPGILVGCVYGLLQLLQDFYVSHPVQLFMDYPLAFAALGLAGIAASLPVKDAFKLPIGIVIGAVGRFVIHLISGAVFFGSYAEPGQTALAYSFLYNIGYMGPDTAICLAASFIPAIAKFPKLLRASKNA